MRSPVVEEPRKAMASTAMVTTARWAWKERGESEKERERVRERGGEREGGREGGRDEGG